ncbi:hypothetical protein [Variovorax beijingensis]|uniref:hypothetical protein n=1 Tax=Variovorax beijingensis TaxID=2496117 RepID=UPI0013DE9708|nr:hypothetical protein [Variovorax beijingensis]
MAIFCANGRMILSYGPPAGAGTTTLMGWVGHAVVCAVATMLLKQAMATSSLNIFSSPFYDLPFCELESSMYRLLDPN